MDSKRTKEKVTDLLARRVESMADLRSSEITDKAIQLLAPLSARSLSDVRMVLQHYFLSNAYPTRVALTGGDDVWLWEQTERQK